MIIRFFFSSHTQSSDGKDGAQYQGKWHNMRFLHHAHLINESRKMCAKIIQLRLYFKVFHDATGVKICADFSPLLNV